MKAFEATGFWHIPADPSRRIAGTLRFSEQEGIRLLLTGSFGADWPDFKPKTYPLVHGIVKESPFGKYFTLVDCIQASTSIGMPGFQTEDLVANHAFGSSQLLEESDQSFTKMQVGYTYLADWFGVSDFTQEYHRSDKTVTGVSVVYKRPAPVEAIVQNNRVRLDPFFSLSESAHAVRVEEQVRLSVDNLKPTDIHEVTRRFGYPFQNLLTLATDTPNAVQELAVFNERIRYPGTDHSAPIYVLFHPISTPEETNRRLFPHDMLFTLADVRGRATELFRQWLSFVDGYGPFCDVFFGQQYAPSSYIDIRFSLVVGALGLLFQNARLPEREAGRAINSLRHQILDVVPEQQRNWLAELLPSAGELDFPWHLESLLQEHEPVMRPLVAEGFDRFISSVVTTKSYVLRRDESLRARAASGKELHRLIEKILVLLKASVLIRIGFDRDQIAQLFNRNLKYQQMKAAFAD